MKKRVALFIGVLLILSITSILAANNETDSNEPQGFDKAYDCLENLILQRGYDDLVFEETAFATLALAYDSGIQGNLRSRLADLSLDNTCWQGDDCNVKDTAQALIALNHVQQSTNLIENWLIDETTEPTELVWYLEIDTNERSECTISYEGGSRDVVVTADKKITGTGGNCFSSGFNGYWLQINDDCYDEDFEITCDKDFITTLAYRKKTSSGLDSPYYISALTNQQPAEGKTHESVNSLCFQKEGDSNSCDYESTLWATLALKKLGKDTSAYLPYLIALASNNERLFPDTFLYMLTNDQEYLANIVNKQDSEGFWQLTNDQTKIYYDTALALLALKGTSSDQAVRATEWLLESQQSSGCWRNTRDTSFILYAADEKTPNTASPIVYCEDSGFYCVNDQEDCENALGTIKSSYNCPSWGKSVCCTVNIDVNETVIPIDPVTKTNACEERGYSCKSFCSDYEEEVAYECSGIEACCAPITEPESSPSYWWVWILVILIILLVLAIIFREQVKVWYFKVKSKFKKFPVEEQRRPSMPPAPRQGLFPRQMPMMPRRQMPRQGMRRPMPPSSPRPFPKEGELQDTLKKLKDMGNK